MKKFTCEVSVADFMNRYVNRGIVKDRKFQRKSCWSSKNETGYISTLLNGGDLDTFSIVDNKASMEAAGQTLDLQSKQYFSAALDSGAYTSIDGQNRENALTRFMNDAFTITGTFCDKDGRILDIKNKHFKDLPSRLRDKLMDIQVAVNLISETTVVEMPKLFQTRNSGKPLNGQENRNSFPSDMSDIIRSLAEDPLISKIWEASQELKDYKIAESADAEMTAKMYMSLVDSEKTISSQPGFSKIDLKKKDLDNFYKMGIGKAMGSQGYPEEYSTYQSERVRRVLKMMAALIQAKGCKKSSVRMRSVWALLISCAHLDAHGKSLKEGRLVDFYDIVTKTDLELLAEGDLQLSKRMVGWNNKGQIGPKPSPSSFYRHRAGNTDASVQRLSRIEMLITRLTSMNAFNKLLVK